MKKYLCISFLLVYTIICCAQTKYLIQEGGNGYNILVIFSQDNKQNELLVDSILQDTLFLKCRDMNIAGDFANTPRNFAKLSVANINNMQIQSTIPFVIDTLFNHFINLNALLCFSKIKRIDEEVVFPKITSIYFQYSDLKEFPKAICSWISLKNIDIQSCKFSTIPKEIGNLQNLEGVNFSDNGIRKFPNEFYMLPKLYRIGLAGNSRIKISPLLCEMKNLKEIYIDKTIFNRMPQSLKNRLCLDQIISVYYL
jgi:Leucine-rich repeat (LRR) protein